MMWKCLKRKDDLAGTRTITIFGWNFKKILKDVSKNDSEKVLITILGDFNFQID